MTEDTPPTLGVAQTTNAAQGVTPADLTPTRIALIGRAGSGKTAVARAVFGPRDEPVVTGAYARYLDPNIPIVMDDVAGWVHGSESTLGAIFTYLEAARDARLPLSAIWYTLDASSARVTDYELRLIQRLARMYPVVVALTRGDLVSADAVAAMRAAFERADIANVLGVVAVSADPLPTLGAAAYGVDAVIALTPGRARQARLAEVETIQPEPATPLPGVADETEEASATRSGASGARQSSRQFAPSGAYAADGADERRAGGPYGAAEMDMQPSRTLIAMLILIPLAVALTLALFFLGRRRAEADDE